MRNVGYITIYGTGDKLTLLLDKQYFILKQIQLHGFNKQCIRDLQIKFQYILY